jgi:hypothetical protein
MLTFRSAPMVKRGDPFLHRPGLASDGATV